MLDHPDHVMAHSWNNPGTNPRRLPRSATWVCTCGTRCTVQAPWGSLTEALRETFDTHVERYLNTPGVPVQQGRP